MSHHLKVVLVAIIATAITVAHLGYYRSQAERAPVEACERLDDQQLVAECLAGVSP